MTYITASPQPMYVTDGLSLFSSRALAVWHQNQLLLLTVGKTQGTTTAFIQMQTQSSLIKHPIRQLNRRCYRQPQICQRLNPKEKSFMSESGTWSYPSTLQSSRSRTVSCMLKFVSEALGYKTTCSDLVPPPRIPPMLNASLNTAPHNLPTLAFYGNIKNEMPNRCSADLLQ